MDFSTVNGNSSLCNTAMEKQNIDSLSFSLTKLSGSSRGIPSDKDFHFYNNFDEFKLPIKGISDKSNFMLDTIGRSSAHLWGKEIVFPNDYDDAHDWLVNVNDEVFERFDFSVDEFQKLRKNEVENGFQLVCGKKKKGTSQLVERERAENSGVPEVKMAFRDKKSMGKKPKIPFHIPSIPRPQDQYKILVNNSTQPFEHAWLERSEDGSRFIHPLEKFSALDFVDKNIGDVESTKPPPVDSNPFKIVEEVKDLKELAAKLRGVDEFAVDLEHNKYRSFQGLTCLMQISTRSEDFVVDTLKLRIHIGPYLRELFKDPTKKKVMHGADRDIIWLQRDFGIYICNMFDTGQASRVLKLERNSLEYLLHHFCEVTANKEYQTADWRLRPLPNEMLRYAREDTHYLLYIYDLMRIRLLSSESENPETSLLEVYQRSYDICMQLYEKEILTESSYLNIYGLQGADFNAQQLAIVAGLCEWRDAVARAEDESHGYILPNKTLLEIASQIPLTTNNLRRLLKSKHPYIERNLGSVVAIIRHSVQNSSAFVAAVEHLKERQMKMASDGNVVGTDGSKPLSPPDAPVRLRAAASESESVGGSNAVDMSLVGRLPGSLQLKEKHLEIDNGNAEIGKNRHEDSSQYPGDNRNVKSRKDGYIPAFASKQKSSHPILGAEATVQVSKKPNRAFWAFLGNSAAKRKFDSSKKEKDDIKLEQIKSSVNLPFRSFLNRDNQLQQVVTEPSKPPENLINDEPIAVQATSSRLQDIISIESDSDEEEPVRHDSNLAEEKLEEEPTTQTQFGEDSAKPLENMINDEPIAVQATSSGMADIIVIESDSDEEEPQRHEESNPRDEKLGQKEENRGEPFLEMDEGEETTMSLSDLSSSFKKCFESTDQTRKAKEVGKSQESDGLLQFKPFDYKLAFGGKEVPGGEIG